MTGNKIADGITEVSRSLPQTSLETIRSERDEEIPKERDIFPEEGHKIIDDLKLIQKYYNRISKNIKFFR